MYHQPSPESSSHQHYPSVTNPAERYPQSLQPGFSPFPPPQQQSNPNQPPQPYYPPPPPSYDHASYHQPSPHPLPNANYAPFPAPSNPNPHQRHHTVPASTSRYIANMSTGPASLPIVTPAYAHPPSHYIKIHSYSPSSVAPPPHQANMTIQCTLLSPSSQPSFSSAPPPPPAKVLRLCFGTLPVQTKVTRVVSFPPDMVSQPVPGQDLALSCKVPLHADVLIAAGKNGRDAGIGPGGSVGLYCEVMGVSDPGGAERVLDRIWFGEMVFEGAGSSSMMQTRSSEGLTIGGWTGEETPSAPSLSVDTAQARLSAKRPGSPLVSPHTTRASPSYQPPQSPAFQQQPQSKMNAQFGSGYERYDDGSSSSIDGQGVKPDPAGSYYQHYSKNHPASAFPPSQSYPPPAPHPGQPHHVPSSGNQPLSHQYTVHPPTLHPQQNPGQWDPSSSSLQPPVTIHYSHADPSSGPPAPEQAFPSGSSSTPQMVRVTAPRPAKAARRANNTSQNDGDESESGSGSAGPSRGGAGRGSTGKSAVQKASLVLQGELGEMAVGWNQEEWTSRRRLVQFWRRQEGSVIHAAFRPINQSDYVDNSIVISCIYREETNECYVTSVDAIYLLEALIGVRFSVEEKNRIRRNLEGLKPDTVSKNKPATEDFFRLLMQLPKPKPRNIEKDVKVFKWMSFGDALKKIIGKYSVAYGSESRPTAPAPAPGVPGPLQQPVYADRSAQPSPGLSLDSPHPPVSQNAPSPVRESQQHTPQQPAYRQQQQVDYQPTSTHSTPSLRPQHPVQSTAFSTSYDIDPLSNYFSEPYNAYDSQGLFPVGSSNVASGSGADPTPSTSSSTSSNRSNTVFDQPTPQLSSSSSTEHPTLVQTPAAFSLLPATSFDTNPTLTTSYKGSISGPGMQHRSSLSLGSIPSFHGSSFDFADYFTPDAPFTPTGLGLGGDPAGAIDLGGNAGTPGGGGGGIAVIAQSSGLSTYTPSSESSGTRSPPLPAGRAPNPLGARVAESASPVLGGGSEPKRGGGEGYFASGASSAGGGAGMQKLGDDVESLALSFSRAQHSASAPPASGSGGVEQEKGYLDGEAVKEESGGVGM